jgi:hypothetical protein
VRSWDIHPRRSGRWQVSGAHRVRMPWASRFAMGPEAEHAAAR